MMLPRVSGLRSAGHGPCRLTVAIAGLALSALADTEPEPVLDCALSSGSVRVYEGSRLFDRDAERLDLARGRTLPCGHPAARRVVAALDGALGNLPPARLEGPVRVHVDPRLPARQAPLSGIEVHVTSREILVASAAFDGLPAEAWRHELLHRLASPPPPASVAERRLWLTLEEGIVGYLTAGAAGDAPVAPPVQLLPLLDWLASPAFDPHPLASGLTRELARAPDAADSAEWLDCLAAVPGSRAAAAAPAAPVREREAAPGSRDVPLPEAFSDVFRAFIGRCSAGAQAQFASALEQWWGAPRRAQPLLIAPELGKAAARWRESR